MLTIKGINIESLPFGNLQLLNNLLWFEGDPLLTHYTDENGYDYLAYWVDSGHDLERWLILKLSKSELYMYLSGGISLYSLFKETLTEYIFFVDYNDNKKRIPVKVVMVNSKDLDNDYYPHENSFFLMEMPSFYHTYLYQYDWENTMKQRSLIFTVKPTNSINYTLVSAEDASIFLNAIAKSAKEYVAFKTHSYFKNIISAPSKLNAFVNKVKERLAPIMPILNVSSFEVGLAFNTTSVTSDYYIDFDWKKEIVEGFKNEVLNVNYNDLEEAKVIEDKFDKETRKKIFEPFMKVLQNEDISIKVESYNKGFQRDYSKNPIREDFRNIVVPKPTKEELQIAEERRLKLYQFVVALEEGQDLKNIKLKDLKDSILFSDEQAETDYFLHSPFTVDNHTYTLTNDIKAKFNLLPDGKNRIVQAELEIELTSDSFIEVQEMFKKKVATLIDRYQLTDPDKRKGDTILLELEKHL